MSEVQLYMNIYDIIPTEPFWELLDDTFLYQDGRQWTKQELIDSIRKDGLHHQLNVDKEGYVKNGNMRYHCCKYLFEEEGDERFRFLPVQRNYATGLFCKEVFVQTEEQLTLEEQNKIMERILTDISHYWVEQVREDTIPSKTEFEEGTIDPHNDIFYEAHWATNKNDWALLSQPNPLNYKTIFLIGVMGKSYPSGKRLSKEEYLAQRDYNRKQREKNRANQNTRS